MAVGPASRLPLKWARAGGSLLSEAGSRSVTAGGGPARLGVALPLPHLLQLSGRYRLNEDRRCPVADWTPVGEWGVSALRLVVVPLLRSVLSSLSPGRAVPRLPPAPPGSGGGALLLPPALVGGN